ncbi:hypothetical protein ACX1C1_16720 [Paenibacillus sp. strain BS8-2]
MANNLVSFQITVNSMEFSQDNVLKWIKEILYFEPSEVYGTMITKMKFIRYQESSILKNLYKELKRDQFTVIFCDKEVENELEFKKSLNNSSISGRLTKELYEQMKDKLEMFINQLFEHHSGIVGSICTIDDYFWQNNTDPKQYEYQNKPVEGINIISHPDFKNDMMVDTESLPGHAHFYQELWFGAHWMMWFGKEYFQYIPRQALLSFIDVYKVEELWNEAIFIQLSHSIWDYDNTEYRRLQWGFRKQVGIDEVVHRLLHDEDELPLTESESDPTIEIFTDDYCNYGGVRLIRYHYDEKKRVVPKSKATVELTYEVDNQGTVLWEEMKNKNKNQLN